MDKKYVASFNEISYIERPPIDQEFKSIDIVFLSKSLYGILPKVIIIQHINSSF